MDAPIRPEVIAETPQTVPAKPWGFWATIGLSLVVVPAMVTVQTLTVIGFLVVRWRLYPQRGLSELAQDAQGSGLLLSAATWAIRFYEKHGFRMVTPKEKDRLLKKYWSIPERQVATSAVLADAGKRFIPSGPAAWR
jgi:hypothetical protein